MAETVPWQPNATVRQVMAHLAAGGCVFLPTESTYEVVASALDERGVKKLKHFAGEQAPAIALGDVGEIADWLPLLSGAGARLVRKLGAGPYLLEGDAGYRTGLFKRVPKFAQDMVSTGQGVRIRLADHPIWSELRALGQPLISVAMPPALDVSEAARLAGDQAMIVVETGATPFCLLPSIVQVDGRRAVLVREGGLTKDDFAEFTRCRVLFVCTGNTCRSPMAEALCVKLLADWLGCTPAQLSQQGYCVQSAGLAAGAGSAASIEGVEIVAEMGADLSQHRSCMVNVEMLLWADHVFAMTSSHWYALRSVEVPGLAEPQLLSPLFEDIADPIGGARGDYQSCAQEILECLKLRLPQILAS